MIGKYDLEALKRIERNAPSYSRYLIRKLRLGYRSQRNMLTILTRDNEQLRAELERFKKCTLLK